MAGFEFIVGLGTGAVLFGALSIRRFFAIALCGAASALLGLWWLEGVAGIIGWANYTALELSQHAAFASGVIFGKLTAALIRWRL